jgi:HAD superfamily hydrolase (TIGR01662 family)
MSAIRAVVFDVGETLLDETRIWSERADRIGVPRLTFLAALGGVIAWGLDHGAVFDLVRPGANLEGVEGAGGGPYEVAAEDLYPDALPCLRRLAAAGYLVAIAANQPATTEAMLRALDVPLALVATSEGLGVSKPDPRFFRRIGDELGLEAREIAYVGDRLDNDIGPAATAGMTAIFLRRGPWAILQAASLDPAVAGAAAVIESLDELPDVLESVVRRSRDGS